MLSFVAITIGHSAIDNKDSYDKDRDGDIYIMMQCLFVTKNHHFLLGVSCNHLNHPKHPVQLRVSFDGSRLVFHGSMSVFIGFQGFRLVSR